MTELAAPSSTVPAAASGTGPLAVLRLVLGLNLHPEATLHPSWLPATWPVRQRVAARTWSPSAQTVLADVLRQRGVLAFEPDYAFDSRLKRLLLLEPAALRRLAFYVSLCAHTPLLRPRRGALSAQLRRQARRFDPDAVEFVLERAPQPTELRMSAHPLQDRPAGCGRVLMDRGYRLLLAALSSEGETAVQRLQRKLPRRVAALELPRLSARQHDQLGELMLSCIVPERLARWDWLF